MEKRSKNKKQNIIGIFVIIIIGITLFLTFFLTFYYKARIYEITFDYQGATINNKIIKTRIGYGEDFFLNVPGHDCYEFLGWYNEIGGAGIQYTDEKGHGLDKWSLKSDIVLYAYWGGTRGLEYSQVYFEEKDNKGGEEIRSLVFVGYQVAIGSVNAENIYIPKYYNGKPVKNIKNNGFNYHLKLKNIVIPDSIISIEANIFNKTSLWNNAPNNSIVYADKWIVGYKGDISNNIIPDNTRGIADSAFDGCKSLTSITIPQGITSIGENTFANCYKLASINIPEGVISIGKEAFYNCHELTNIKIPEEITSIGENTFANCYKLASINIPEKVISIGKEAFYNCHELTNIKIPEEITSIGENTFANCYKLASINIPEKVISIGKEAFYNCTSLLNIDVNENNKIYSSVDGVLFNRDQTTLICYPAGKSGVYAIPSSVKNISEKAFANCNQLTKIMIPEEVSSIAGQAFYNCTSLLNIDVNESNKIYSSVDGVLFNRDQTTLICYPAGKSGVYTIPSSVKSIGSYAFSNCNNFTNFIIPSNVTSIDFAAFYGCNNLVTITVPFIGATLNGKSSAYFAFIFGSLIPSQLETVTITGGDSIGERAFAGCSSLINITLPSSVISIGGRAFEDCSNLINITLSSSLSSIGSRAFEGCSSLTNIILPNSIIYIGSNAFSDCHNLNIFCEVASEPNSWHPNWNPNNKPIFWGYTKD